MKSLFILMSCSVGLLACSAESDPTYNLTGTEELAVQTEDGEYVCEAPKKVLICHIPPGNPDNAHTICVSTHAVEVHQEHHGDLVGACDGGGDDDDDDDDGEDGVDAGGQQDPPPDDVPIE